MILYGYDASVYNSVQGSKHWVEWFDDPGSETIGSINSVYTVGAIIGGWFIGGPISDYFGRKVGMGVGCVMVIIATFMQAYAPWHGLGTFIGGRVVVGLGQGVALSEISRASSSKKSLLTLPILQHLALSTSVNSLPQKFAAKSWLSGRPSTLSAPSFASGSITPLPNIENVWVNGIGS